VVFFMVLLYVRSLDQEFVIYALYLQLRHVGYSFMFGFELREKVQRDERVKTRFY
jgi:hypothetical protein